MYSLRSLQWEPKTRYAILSDIHSNLTAFQAVLADLEARGGFDELWCPGDIVGYGPDPEECVKLLQSYRHIAVAGNHDWAAVGKVDTADFNPAAAWAAAWTAQQLGEEERKYLEALPLKVERENFTLVHGSPREPIWEYLLSPVAALENFSAFSTPYCLIGHSHIPLVFKWDAEKGQVLGEEWGEEPLSLGGDRLIINPGGVGQPRDGDPRASYALYDSSQGLLWHFRVSYSVEEVQERMRRFSLPRGLIERLSYGL